MIEYVPDESKLSENMLQLNVTTKKIHAEQRRIHK